MEIIFLIVVTIVQCELYTITTKYVNIKYGRTYLIKHFLENTVSPCISSNVKTFHISISDCKRSNI
jgi:hypothetical protein